MMGRYSQQPGKAATTSKIVRSLCEKGFARFHRSLLFPLLRPFSSLRIGRTSFRGGRLRSWKRSFQHLGTLVALGAHDDMRVPLELSDLFRNQLWRRIRCFSRCPPGNASTKGKPRSDPSASAHRHKLAVFPHKVVDGYSGQREGDDGRDTNTTYAGPRQADLVRPLATAKVCSVSGLRIGTVHRGQPRGPSSPGRVKTIAATEDTEVASSRARWALP